jgi:hypothetical protein
VKGFDVYPNLDVHPSNPAHEARKGSAVVSFGSLASDVRDLDHGRVAMNRL